MSDQYPNRLAQFVATELIRRKWGDREAGRRLKLNHVTIGNIISGATRNPDDATLDKLATLREGVDRETLRRWLYEAAVPDTQAPAVSRTEWSPSGDDIYEVIRLTAEHAATSAVQKAVKEMSRRRPPVEPEPDPVLARILTEVREAWSTMSPEQLAEAEECWRVALQGHRRQEITRSQTSQ